MNNVSIEVIIILAGMYYLLAVVVSFLVELLAVRGRWRGRFLRQSIYQFFENTDYGVEFYNSRIIRDLFSKTILGKQQPPSAIESKTFAEVCIHVLFAPLGGKTTKLNKQAVTTCIQDLNKEQTKQYRALSAKLTTIKSSAVFKSEQSAEISFSQAMLDELAVHFEEMQNRLVGRYRRKAKTWTLILSGVLTLLLYFDSIATFKELYQNAAIRSSLSESAERLTYKDTGVLEDFLKGLQKLTLGGEGKNFNLLAGIYSFPNWILGFTISTVALSLGAPFWYDVLGRLAALRSGGKTNESKKESSEKEIAEAVQTPIESSTTEKSALKKELELDPECEVWPLTDNALKEFKNKNSRITQSDLIICGAAASRLVYRNLDYINNLDCFSGWIIRSEGVAHNANLKTTDKDFVGDTQVYSFDHDEALILSFRGTEAQKMSDVWTNTRVDQDLIGSGSGSATVHRGFLAALDMKMEDGKTLQQKLTTVLEKAAKDQKRILITGHSLGGALAHLFTVRYLLQKGQNMTESVIQSCITFGAPRIGNEAFAKLSDQKGETQILRFVNQADIVSRIPLLTWGYRHTSSGYIMGNDEKWMPLEKSDTFHRLAIWFEGIMTYFANVNGSKTDAPFFLSDHAMSEYHRLVVQNF